MTGWATTDTGTHPREQPFVFLHLLRDSRFCSNQSSVGSKVMHTHSAVPLDDISSGKFCIRCWRAIFQGEDWLPYPMVVWFRHTIPCLRRHMREGVPAVDASSSDENKDGHHRNDEAEKDTSRMLASSKRRHSILTVLVHCCSDLESSHLLSWIM